MKIFPASILAVAAILVSHAPATAAERMVAIYAGPSGISIPASALAPAPAQPAVETAPVAEGTQSSTVDVAGEARRAIVVHTASTSLR